MRSVDVDPSAHEAPHHLALDGAGHVFVALAFPPADVAPNDKHAGHGGSDSAGALLRLDQKTLGVEASRDVDQNPGDVVMTHDHNKVLVTHYDMRRAMQKAKAGGNASSLYARLIVLDAKTLESIAAREVCVAPHGIAVDAHDALALVACYGSDEIALVDISNRSLFVTHVPIATAGVPGAPRFGPYSVTLTRSGTRALVADLESRDVRVLDVALRQFVDGAVVTVGGRAMMADFVSDTVAIVPLQSPDGLARVDIDKLAVTERVTFGAECKNPHVVRVAPDARVYVVCEGDHVMPGAVLEIEPLTLATKKRWVVGVYPDGIGF